MSEQRPRPDAARSPGERRADHEAIERLTDDLLPALVARLGASALGELEVREDGWRVRIRRPAGERRLPTGGRGAPGRGREEGRHPADGVRSEGAPRRGEPTPAAAPDPSDGASSADAPALPPLTSVSIEPADLADGPLVATSPAVGIFRARDIRTGSRVRAGDRLATVDMLGVPQEVSAPADGIVATALVEDGDAVEYGQPLVVLEPIGPAGKGA